MPGGTDRGRGLAMQGHGLVDGQWAVLIERWPSTEDPRTPRSPGTASREQGREWEELKTDRVKS